LMMLRIATSQVVGVLLVGLGVDDVVLTTSFSNMLQKIL